MTMKQLGDALGMKISRIQKWETEICIPSDAIKRQVAEYFNVDFDELNKEEDIKHQPSTAINAELKKLAKKMESSQNMLSNFVAKYDDVDLDVALKYSRLSEVNQQIVRAQIEFLLTQQSS